MIVSAEPVTSTIVTMLPITRPISKVIVIGKPLETGRSGSKPKEISEKPVSKDKGKSILIENQKKRRRQKQRLNWRK